jgi:hypothetical protein
MGGGQQPRFACFTWIPSEPTSVFHSGAGEHRGFAPWLGSADVVWNGLDELQWDWGRGLSSALHHARCQPLSRIECNVHPG